MLHPNATVLQAGQNFHVTGGSDKYMIDLMRLLERRGFQAIPFAAQHERNLASSWSGYFPRRVNFTSPRARDLLAYLYSRDAARKLQSLLQAERVDIAHLHIYYGQLTGSILPIIKKHHIPIVQTLHEYKTVCPTYDLVAHGKICERCRGFAYYRALPTRCNRGSLSRTTLSVAEAYTTLALGGVSAVDTFIAVSNFQKTKLVEMGLPEERIDVIHNFVDCSAIEPNYDGGTYLLYFGRLEETKGVYTLLRAAERLTNVAVKIVGDGSQREGIKRYVREKQLKSVSLLDFKSQAELKGIIDGCLCTVVPSEWFETFGLTALESLAHGKPVIASAIGGLTEIVEDGVSGLLFPPGDVSALQERMQWMVTHDASAGEMGRAGRRIAVEKFNPEVHVSKIEKVYDQLF